MNEKRNKGDFSFDTIESFDEHIGTSIPRYKDIHACIDGMLQYFVVDGSKIVDLGCSTGSLLTRIDKKYHDKDLVLHGYDSSKNLLPSDSSGRAHFFLNDITDEELWDEMKKSDIIFSIFTLCFIPYAERRELVQNVYYNLNDGGVFIFTDKVYASDPRIQDIFTFLYYDFKRQTYTSEQILDKEISLREIQKPLTTEQNYDMLSDAGFDRVESFWKYYNFQGWICIK